MSRAWRAVFERPFLDLTVGQKKSLSRQIYEPGRPEK